MAYLFCSACASENEATVVTIENEVLSVSVSTLGAELQSIRHLSTGEEYLWQGDPAYWDARAPVMFPVNVRFKDDRFTYRGNTYEMPRLGLAVDALFKVMDDSRRDRITLELSSDKNTLMHYPFPFRFELSLILDGNRLVHHFIVENTGSDTMYFALGGHPGLRCPLEAGLTRGDYQLVFPERLHLERLEVDSSLILPSRQPFLQDERAFALDDPRVPGSGMFLQNLPVSEIGIGRVGQDPYVSVDLGDFPNVNIWTPPGMPYVCIEPMVGHHDLLHSPEAINEKSFLTALPPGRQNEYSFSIIVYGGIGSHASK
jgi:galactose mutarotase-like enzyme